MSRKDFKPLMLSGLYQEYKALLWYCVGSTGGFFFSSIKRININICCSMEESWKCTKGKKSDMKGQV